MQTENNQVLRTRILENCEEIFGAEGYNATTMDRVARASGISKPTLYKYYHNKNTLFDAMYRKTYQDYFCFCFQLMRQQEKDKREILLEMIKAMQDFLKRKKPTLRRLILEYYKLRDPSFRITVYTRNSEKLLQQFDSFFSGMLEEQLLREYGARQVSQLFMSLLEGMYRSAIVRDGDPEELSGDLIIRMLFHGMFNGRKT